MVCLQRQAKKPLVHSYLFMRTAIGIIGVALPFVLIIGKIILESPGISGSISAYYYSVMGDVFVGSLCATGIFLICYRFDYLDDFVSTIAGICAIGVALFPTTPDVPYPTPQQMAIGLAHGSFASCFFIILALMAIFLFRRTDQDNPKRRKQQRNIVYLICGIVILACVVLAALILFVLPATPWLGPLHPIFWLESLSIFAFGVAWFVKGGAILKDE